MNSRAQIERDEAAFWLADAYAYKRSAHVYVRRIAEPTVPSARQLSNAIAGAEAFTGARDTVQAVDNTHCRRRW